MSSSDCNTSVQPLLYVPHHVCQSTLGYILELRRQRSFLDELISESETAIRAALEARAIVEAGAFCVYLNQSKPNALVIS
jgi:hypothetical protein